MSRNVDSAQKEVESLFRLKFYQKQKNWKFCPDECRRRDADRQTPKSTSASPPSKLPCKPPPSAPPSSPQSPHMIEQRPPLDTTYNIEQEECSILNEAFVESLHTVGKVSPPPNSPCSSLQSMSSYHCHYHHQTLDTHHTCLHQQALTQELPQDQDLLRRLWLGVQEPQSTEAKQATSTEWEPHIHCNNVVNWLNKMQDPTYDAAAFCDFSMVCETYPTTRSADVVDGDWHISELEAALADVPQYRVVPGIDTVPGVDSVPGVEGVPEVKCENGEDEEWDQFHREANVAPHSTELDLDVDFDDSLVRWIVGRGQEMCVLQRVSHARAVRAARAVYATRAARAARAVRAAHTALAQLSYTGNHEIDNYETATPDEYIVSGSHITCRTSASDMVHSVPYVPDISYLQSYLPDMSQPPPCVPDMFHSPLCLPDMSRPPPQPCVPDMPQCVPDMVQSVPDMPWEVRGRGRGRLRAMQQHGII